MEGSSAPLGASPRSEPGGLRVTQVGLLISCLGAAMVIFGLFGIVGIFLALGGAALAAPGGFGHRWYIGVVLGAIVLALSKPIADGAQTLGGWMAVIGGIAILVATSLGFPVRGDRSE
jgi:hypothetical protein